MSFLAITHTHAFAPTRYPCLFGLVNAGTVEEFVAAGGGPALLPRIEAKGSGADSIDKNSMVEDMDDSISSTARGGLPSDSW